MKISAHIPPTYISSEADRMEMYKKISLIRTDEDRVDVEDELCDRFGEMPRVTERLLLVSATRAMATDAGITKISVTESMITIKCKEANLSLWSEVFAKYPTMRFAPGDPTVILYRFVKADPPRLLHEIITLAYKTAKDMEEENPSG
jgi:transcription-repair coupling factor (superfamily II helicase)